jgi:hypothetical protein
MLADPVRLELAVVGAVHLVFVGRLLAGRHASSRQRALDLERFRRIKQTLAGEVGEAGKVGSPGE